MAEGEQTEQWESRIIGLAKQDCGVCKGHGRRNWLDRENARVQPCSCVLYYDMEMIRAASEEAIESNSGTENGDGSG